MQNIHSIATWDLILQDATACMQERYYFNVRLTLTCCSVAQANAKTLADGTARDNASKNALRIATTAARKKAYDRALALAKDKANAERAEAVRFKQDVSTQQKSRCSLQNVICI